MQYVDLYLEFLWKAFSYDMYVYSQAWIYVCLLIPAICYTIFFFFKWIILLTPILIPLKIISKIFFKIFIEVIK